MPLDGIPGIMSKDTISRITDKEHFVSHCQFERQPQTSRACLARLQDCCTNILMK